MANKIKKFKNLSYKSKVLFFSKVSFFINAFIFLGKAIMGFCFDDMLILISSVYSFFIALTKYIFLRGEKRKDKDVIKYNYYLYIILCLFIGSSFYLLYWILALIYGRSIVRYPLLQFVLYLVVCIIEFVFSIKGLLISNKEKDLLLNGVKFVNLSTAITSLILMIMLIKSLKGIANFYIINYFGIVISFIMLGVWYYSIHHKNVDNDL